MEAAITDILKTAIKIFMLEIIMNKTNLTTELKILILLEQINYQLINNQKDQNFKLK